MGQVEIYLRTRKQRANDMGRKTAHGMASTEKHLDGIYKSENMKENLSQGHLSEKHIACHKQKELPPAKQAIDDVLADINKTNRTLGYQRYYYEPGEINHAPTKEQQRAMRWMNTASSSSFKNLFNRTGTMTPFAKRLVNGVIKLKQVRPMRILLEAQERTVIKHKAAKSYKYRRIDYKKGHSKTGLKAQVVYPKY